MGWRDWAAVGGAVLGAAVGGFLSVPSSSFSILGVQLASGAIAGALQGTLLGSMAGMMLGSIGSDDLKNQQEITAGYDQDILNSSNTYTQDYTYPVLTVQEGTPIPRAYGRVRLAGNIIRSNDPDDPTNVDVLVGHCGGPIDAILTYWINSLGRSELSSTGHAHVYFTGTTIQAYSTYFSDTKNCKYRGLAYSAIRIAKGDEIRSVQNINAAIRGLKCLEIGQEAGGVRSWTRNPAQVLWDWYIDVEGYSASDLEEDAFLALYDYCSAIPTNAEEVPVAPPGIDTDRVTSTNTYSAVNSSLAPFAFRTDVPLTGTPNYRGYLSNSGTVGSIRINADYGVPYLCEKVVIENYHNADMTGETIGIKNFVVQASNDAASLSDVTYAGTGWTMLSATTHTAVAHTAVDVEEPQTFTFTNTTPYRYYSLKIQDNQGSSAFVGVRHIKFYAKNPRYTFDYIFDTEVSVNDAKKLIWKSYNGSCIMSQGKIKPVWDAAEGFSTTLLEDETGASWGFQYNGKSLANGQAFFAASGVDLSPYAGTEGSDTPYLLKLWDSSGNEAKGYIGAADAGETLSGVELVLEPGFETIAGGDADDDGIGDNFTSWTEVTGGSSTVEATATKHGGSRALKLNQVDTTCYVWQKITLTAGKLYKLSFWTRGDGTYAGKYQIRDQTAGVSITGGNITTGVSVTDYTQVVRYFTAPADPSDVRIYFVSLQTPASPAVAYFDDISVQEVTHCAATGVHIVSTRNGATRNWNSVSSSFSYNGESYTFEVTKPLSVKTSQYTFNVDTIVKGSFSWGKAVHSNIVRIGYINSRLGFIKDTVEIKDTREIADKGEVLSDDSCYFITETDVATRRARFKFEKGRLTDYVCQLTGFPGSQRLEIFDRVSVSHPGPAWSAKDFLVRAKGEDEYGRPIFQLEAYYSGIYHDRGFEFPLTYGSRLPNPFRPPPAIDVSGVTVSNVSVGSINSFGGIKVTFTPPNDPLYSYTEIYISTDDTTFYLAGTSEGSKDTNIAGMGVYYQPGDTVYVRLRPVNANGVAAVFPTTSGASVIATGYIRLSSFYFGNYDYWAGNKDVTNAATKFVLGGLDGTPKVALGAGADHLTLDNSGTCPGFYVDGDGNFRVGGAYYMKFDAGAGSLDINGGVTASYGSIGGWHIATTSLWNVSGTTGLRLDAGNSRIRSNNYVSGVLGAGFSLEPELLEVGNIRVRGTLRSAVFQKDVVSAVGGNLFVRPADVLATDMTASESDSVLVKEDGDSIMLETPELSRNNGFETYTGTADDGASDNWGDWSEAYSDGLGEKIEATATAHGGSAAVKITKSSYLQPYLYQFISVVAGAVYDFSFWTRGDGTNAGRYDVYDNSNNAFIIAQMTSTGVAGTSYVQVTNAITAPAECSQIRIRFWCNTTPASVVYFDDVSFASQGTIGILVDGYSSLVTDGDETFAVGDILRIKDGLSDEWMKIAAASSASQYYVVRDLQGAYGVGINPTWTKGASVVNFGQGGDGGIYMTSSESYSPYIAVVTHSGMPWLDMETRLRIGNLNGFLDYTSDAYGIAIGDNSGFLKYDPTNGLRIRGYVSVTDGGIIASAVQLQSGYIRTAETYPYLEMSPDGIQLKDSDNGGTYGTAVYGTDKYGAGALAWIFNSSYQIPWYEEKEPIKDGDDVASIHFFDRDADPAGGTYAQGEIAMVTGLLKIYRSGAFYEVAGIHSTEAASSGAGTVKMASGNPADNTGWIQIGINKYVPYWSDPTP